MKYATFVLMMLTLPLLCHCGVVLMEPTHVTEDAGALMALVDADASADGDAGDGAGDAAGSDVDAAPPLVCSDAGTVRADAASSPVLHDNGVGQQYQSYDPLGTHDALTAGHACQAYRNGPPFQPGECVQGSLGCASCETVAYVRAGFDTIVWAYAGPAKGRVATSANGRCPTTADPVWN